MDRRRYVPSPEGLEGRTLLATTAAASPFSLFGTSVATTQTLPITFAEKEMRIEKMPLNLRALEPNRFLPPDTIHAIQIGLNTIIGELEPAPSSALTKYNLAMRKIVFHSSLSTKNAELLNHGFTGVLKAAGTPEPGLSMLANAVNQLVTQVDTASVRPTFLATNDNTYILQLALVLGQPMPAPRVPTIAKTTGAQIKPGLYISPLSNPTFDGTYVFGTTMQMLNPNTNAVVGQAVVAKNGQYALTIATPLGLGTHKLVVRAVDEVGHLSHASREFTLKIVPPKHHHVTVGQTTPQGPLATKSQSTTSKK